MPGIIHPTVIGGIASLAVVTYLTSYPSGKAHQKKKDNSKVPDEWITVKQSNGRYITLDQFKKRLKNSDYYDQELHYIQNSPQEDKYWQKKQAALYQRTVQFERRRGSTETFDTQRRAAHSYGKG